jgi:hypothetical protein
MVSRTVPDAFDIWDGVECVFVPRVNSPNEPLWNGRLWREADIRKTSTPAQHATSPLLGHLQTFLVG